MVNFFKNFGKGVLYVLVLPFLLVGLAVYGVVALFIFIFLAIKGLVLFFTGRSLYEDLPEDKEANRRLAGVPPKEETNSAVISGLNEQENSNPTTNDQSVDPFYVPEYLKTDEMKEEQQAVEEEQSFFEEEPQVHVEEPVKEQPNIVEDKSSPIINSQEDDFEDDVINVEQNPQNETIIKISDLDDEDDDNGFGINIDYE